jgi:hypothetical protein
MHRQNAVASQVRVKAAAELWRHRKSKNHAFTIAAANHIQA